MGHHLEEAAMQQLVAMSVETLCMSTVTYHEQLTIEGIIGIRVDNSHVLLVKLDQSLKRDCPATLTDNMEGKSSLQSHIPKADDADPRTSDLNVSKKRRSARIKVQSSGGSANQMVTDDVEACSVSDNMDESNHLSSISNDLNNTDDAEVFLGKTKHVNGNLDASGAAEASSLAKVAYGMHTLPSSSNQENVFDVDNDVALNTGPEAKGVSYVKEDTANHSWKDLDGKRKGKVHKGSVATRGKFTEHFDAVTKDGKVVKYTCKKCSYEAKKKYCMQRHMSTHGMFLYLCSECGKPMPDALELKDHIRFVHDNQVLQCPVCNQTFRSRQGFHQHQVIHNTQKDNNAYCAICDKQFGAVGSFRMHQRVKHQGETHPCPHCNKVFRYKTGLKSHLQTCLQNPESPTIQLHSCMICDKQYRRSSTLREHLKSVHAGQQSFKCQKCGECLKSRSALFRHKSKNRCQEQNMNAALMEDVEPQASLPDASNDLSLLTNIKQDVESVASVEENFHQAFLIIGADEQLTNVQALKVESKETALVMDELMAGAATEVNSGDPTSTISCTANNLVYTC